MDQLQKKSCTKIKKFILITNFKSSNELFFHRIIVDVKQMIESCRLRGFVCTAYRLCKKHYLLYFSKKVYADRDTSRIWLNRLTSLVKYIFRGSCSEWKMNFFWNSISKMSSSTHSVRSFLYNKLLFNRIVRG